MTREENLFLAKKVFTELVFNSAYIEGVNVTFPQTQAILDGSVVNNISVTDIQTVLNLRDAWRYCINTIDEPLTLAYACKINEFVSRNESLNWGTLRDGQVGIGGTEYVPPIPDKEHVVTRLQEISEIADPTEKALEYFCYAVRGQLFWDGNKRTSTIVASKILIEAGAGVLTIGKADALDFNNALLLFYDTNDPEPLKQCLSGCIKTLSRPVPERSLKDRLSAAKEQADQRNADHQQAIKADLQQER